MNTLNKKQLLDISHQTNISIDVLETIDSTNDFLKKASGTDQRICIADYQTHGRGQRRTSMALTRRKKHLFFYRHPFTSPTTTLSGLSLAIGVTLCHLLAPFLPTCRPLIKWPNDILCENRKIAGVLTELKSTQHQNVAIIGIGINANMTPQDNPNIDQPWTSIRHLTGTPCDRNQLYAALIQAIPLTLTRFEQEGLASFLPQWETIDALYNTPICIRQGHSISKGIGQGITTEGHLILQTKNQGKMTFPSGEILRRNDIFN